MLDDSAYGAINIPLEVVPGSLLCPLLPRQFVKSALFAVGEKRSHLEHMVHCLAVHDGVRAAGIVPHHAAHGGPIARRNIRAEFPTERFQVGIELVQDYTGLHPRPSLLQVYFQDLVHVFGALDYDGNAYGLARQACSASARKQGNRVAGRERNSGYYVVMRPRESNPQRLDLIDAGVCAVQDPGKPIRANLAGERTAQLRYEFPELFLRRWIPCHFRISE